jgi:hypothetical protein
MSFTKGFPLRASRIDQVRDQARLRNHLAEQPEPFKFQFAGQDVEAGHIANRPTDAGNEAHLDRIVTGREHDWNRRRGGLGCERCGGADSDKDGNPARDQVGGERWQSIVLAFSPAELDCNVLTFDVTAFGQTVPERGHKTRERRGRSAVQIPHHRHRRLLRPRRERPCRRRAAEQRDELAASHSIELHSVPSQGRIAGYRIGRG